MPGKIGLLLPRSGEYPAMSFDLNDGLRLGLKESGLNDIEIVTDNIGFGENPQIVHSKAEKLVLTDEVDLIIAYATSLNAETLYSFSQTTSKPILFLDAGMELFEAPPSPLCYHITLQGLQACQLVGKAAAEGGRKIIATTSFYDGGYRGSWFLLKGIQESQGAVCGNFVSAFKPEEFSIDQLLYLLTNAGGHAVTVNFSMYLSELYMKALKEKAPLSISLPFYCSPFMAEEIWLSKCDFPGGTFNTIVPWATTLENPAQLKFNTALRTKNKTGNIFSLLGWEAGLTAAQMLTNGSSSLDNWSYESPRGKVTIHPESHVAYAPLYNGNIVADENGKSKLIVNTPIEISAEEHLQVFRSRLDGEYSRWKNNYFCI